MPLSIYIASIADYDSEEQVYVSTSELADAALLMLIRRCLEPGSHNLGDPSFVHAQILAERDAVRDHVASGDAQAAAAAFNATEFFRGGKTAQTYSLEVSTSLSELQQDYPEMLIAPGEFTFARLTGTLRDLPIEDALAAVARAGLLPEGFAAAQRAQAVAKSHGDERMQDFYVRIGLVRLLGTAEAQRAVWDALAVSEVPAL